MADVKSLSGILKCVYPLLCGLQLAASALTYTHPFVSLLPSQGRGGSTGYDNAVALPARADAEELLKENLKTTQALKGSAVFSVAKVDAATGEIAGVFESIQPSDTDLGAKPPKDIKITGLWYGQLTKA